MTGTAYQGTLVPLTGDIRIDALTYGGRFTGSSFGYGFSASVGHYGAGYSLPCGGRPGELASFSPATTASRLAVRAALEGPGAAVGCSVEGFTRAAFAEQAPPASGLFTVHHRFAQTAMRGSGEIAYANQGGTAPLDRAGDVWFKAGAFADVRPGSLGWYVTLHETGHALGLKHPHEGFRMTNGDWHGVLPARLDAMEYTVMSYRSYPGEVTASVGGNARFDHPQSWMMLDIRVLQSMFGADYTVNAGNTVYSWRPGQGDTFVNGQRAIDGPGDTIFATIWDGGGSDCYDLSAYRTGLRIDLRPGQASVFDRAQLAVLDQGSGRVAQGNVYNALQLGTDRRSLIEQATGGEGADVIIGNQAGNLLRGRGGADFISGLAGNDMVVGGAGADRFVFNRRGDGRDTIVDFDPDQAGEAIWLRGSTTLTRQADVVARLVQVGADVELRDSDGDVLVLRNVALGDLGPDDFIL